MQRSCPRSASWPLAIKRGPRLHPRLPVLIRQSYRLKTPVDSEEAGTLPISEIECNTAFDRLWPAILNLIWGIVYTYQPTIPQIQNYLFYCGVQQQCIDQRMRAVFLPSRVSVTHMTV